MDETRKYTITETSQETGIPLGFLQLYKRLYLEYIPGIVGPFQRMRFTDDSLQVLRDIHKLGGGTVREAGYVSRIITLGRIDTELCRMLAAQPDLLRTLHWREFEKVLAKILEKLEYEIELTRATKDGGIDIFAIKKKAIFGPHKYIVQAKRTEKAVGVEPVRELLFLTSDHRVSKSCLATTSRFTKGAWDLAEQYKWELELKDHDRLQEWIQIAFGNTGQRRGQLS